MLDKEIGEPGSVDVDDRLVLKAALLLLYPLREMFTKITQACRARGIVIRSDEIFPVRFPAHQIEMIAKITQEIEDGLISGWDEARHKLLFGMIEQALQVVRDDAPVGDM